MSSSPLEALPLRACIAMTAFVLTISGVSCRTADSAQTGSSGHPFVVEVTNDLGVKATVRVASFTAGSPTWGDNNQDDLTEELNFEGGQWPKTNSGASVPFQNTFLVMKLPDAAGPRWGPYILIPWKHFKRLSQRSGDQVVTLDDGTEYRGRLRTILFDSSASENRQYELGEASSIAIVSFPPDPHAQETKLPHSEWSLSYGADPALNISNPQILHEIEKRESFRGAGANIERSFWVGLASGAFRVKLDANSDDSRATSAAISDFEQVKIGGDKNAFGMPITVKALNRAPASGLIIGPTQAPDDYLNGTLNLAADLPNGCRMVIALSPRTGDTVTLVRIPNS